MTTTATSPDWHARAAALRPDGRLFINGVRCAALDGQTFTKVSPLNGLAMAEVARGQGADVDLAVQSARVAFADRRWAGQSPKARKKVLQRWAELVLAARDELALLETMDMGKPIAHSLAVDVPSTANCLAWYGEAIDKVYDEIAPTADTALALITREAMGVIGAIVPWNYPLIMAAWKLGPALAVGNSVVLKPSEKSPFTALRLAELAVQAGLPAGVLNVVPGYGHEAGEALALHMDVDAIGFTGSTRIGRRMLACSAESNLKRVYNELGGKSAFVVFNDAKDVAAAARAAAGAVFYNQGESCNAPTRVLVQQDVVLEFMAALQDEARKYLPGDPLQESTPMGALVDAGQMDTVLGYIQQGQTEGARLAFGGQRVRTESGGYFVEPTIFEGVHNGMRIAREEIFGPVLGVIPFATE
nr:aldehyde dehydrogenase family protein [Rhodoferax sp.]